MQLNNIPMIISGKEVPLAIRESIIDSYQYGDSLTQVTIGENIIITIDYVDTLLKELSTIVGNIDDSNALSQCIKNALKEIPSVTILKTISSLLSDDNNQLLLKQIFSSLKPDTEKFIVKELFYAINYLVYKKCFNDDSVTFLTTFLPDIESMKDDTKNHLTDMAIIFSKISNLNNSKDIIEIISRFDISFIKYIDQIFQSLEYALFFSENNYKDSQMFSEKNVMLVLTFIDQCINKYINTELVKTFSSWIIVLYDAKLLTNEMLDFLNDYLLKNSKFGNYINNKVKKLSEIFNELRNMETSHNNNVELLCIVVQNSGPIELIEFLINQKVEVDAISSLYGKSALSVGVEKLITYYDAPDPFDTEFNNYIDIVSYLLIQYIEQGIITDVKKVDLIQYFNSTSIVNKFLSSQEDFSKLLKFIYKNNWVFLAESLLNISDYQKTHQLLERHGQEFHNWIVKKEHNNLISLFSILNRTGDLITNLEKNVTHIWDNVDRSVFFNDCLQILRNAHDKNLLSNEFILFLHEFFLKIVQLTTGEFKIHMDKLSNIFSKLSSTNTNNPEGELLCLSALYGHIELVKFLIAKEIDINFISSYGKSSLHLAIENKNLDVIIYLFEKLIKQGSVRSVEMKYNILHHVPHDIRLQLREKVINNFLLTLEGCETLLRFICKNDDVTLAEELIRMNPLVLHEVLRNKNHNFLVWLRNPQFTELLHTLSTIKQADNIINQLRGNITYIQSPIDDNVLKELEKTCKAREGKIYRIKNAMKKLAKGRPDGTYLKLFIYSIATGLISKEYLPLLREILIEEIQNSAKDNPDFINQLVREVLPNINISSVNILSDTSKIDLSRDQAVSDKQKKLAAMAKQLEQGAEKYRTSENLMISEYEYGPLQKSDATKTLEFITRALMNDTAEIEIGYSDDDIITVKIKTPETGEIELSELMRSANFEHLVFESEDIQQFNEYISKNLIAWPFSSLQLTDQKIEDMKSANELGHDLTNLENGSLKAINLYTNDTISHPLNNLLEGHYDNQLNKDSIKCLLLIGMFALHGLNVPLPTLPDEKVIRKQAVTYRGISERDKNIFSNIIKLLSQIKSDDPMDKKIIIDIKKLVSASVDPHVSISFGEEKNIKDTIIFVHSSSKDISSISQHPEEKEMIFAGDKIVAELDQHNQNIIATVIRSPSTHTQLSMFSKKDSQIEREDFYVSMIDSFNSKIDAYLSSQYPDLSHFKALKRLYSEMKVISPRIAEFIVFIHSEQKDDNDRPLTAQEKATKLFINFSEYEHEELEKIKDYPLLHTLINDFMKHMKVLITTPHQRFD
ncbi:MAG: ankyrin repeat domain-containing protein [Gammaproteobacteria bacterium]|nr:ankyrin repeat domain-containing protein [Gammaproteobacteria bacterium]